jgi:hypothetical protein
MVASVSYHKRPRYLHGSCQRVANFNTSEVRNYIDEGLVLVLWKTVALQFLEWLEKHGKLVIHDWYSVGCTRSARGFSLHTASNFRARRNKKVWIEILVNNGPNLDHGSFRVEGLLFASSEWTAVDIRPGARSAMQRLPMFQYADQDTPEPYDHQTNILRILKGAIHLLVRDRDVLRNFHKGPIRKYAFPQRPPSTPPPQPAPPPPPAWSLEDSIAIANGHPVEEEEELFDPSLLDQLFVVDAQVHQDWHAFELLGTAVNEVDDLSD